MTREEAIEVYNGLINQKIREAFEFFAPELAESEDERIRKECISIIKHYGHICEEEGDPCPTIGKCLAYLEKQKEQKPVQTKAEREYVRTLKSLIADFLRGKEDVDRTYYQQIYDWLDGRHIEQNPASTEDMPYITDEHFYEREPADSFKYKLAEYMTKCCTKKEGPYGYEYGLSAETILKMAEEELLKRGVVQKPVKWSEEDEKLLDKIEVMLDSYCDYLEDASSNYIPEVRETISRLKSIRPSWKPSEEQMEAFRSYIKDFQEKAEAAVGGWNNFDVMIRLYEQLKKQM